MGRVCALQNTRGTLRTPLITMRMRTTLMMVAAVVAMVVVGLPVTLGQNHSLEYEYVPLLNDSRNETTNASHSFPSVRQDYKAIYFKCRCEGNQAWSGYGCVDSQIKVYVTNPDTRITEVSLTDDFARVTVRNVQCASDHLLLHLNPNHYPSHQFTLLPHGALLWRQREYEHYCIEHTLDTEGLAPSWEAQVCLPPPAVPRCCLQGTEHTADGSSCSDDNPAQQFSPQIMIDDEQLVQWPQITAGNVRKCKQNEKVLRLPLNTGQSHLSYESGNVSIVWTTPYYIDGIQKEGFCVAPREGGGYVATICQEDHDAIHRNLCANVTCVRKCCPEGEILLGTDCVAAQRETQLWKPYFVDADLVTNVTPPEHLTLLYGRPQCSMYAADPLASEDDKFYLLRNGDLFTPSTNVRDPPNRYCVDNFITGDDETVTLALICFTEEQVEPVCATAMNNVYPALFLVSTIFLGATLVIYLTVPDMRDKLHGRCLISLASAFFVAYVLMSASYLRSTMLPPAICTALAFFKHLSLLAAFFWLNIMCFDIWRTLRKTRAVTGGRRSLHRFLRYSLYAWGCPLTIALTAVVLDQLPASYSIIRPKFTTNMSCWFPEAKSLWVYFYAWVSLLLVANIVFFILVMVILVKGQNNSMLRRSREVNRERMWLYVKLFLVMGVTWVAEVVSYQDGNCVEWMFMDIINALEGFILFLVFILNRSTLRKIRARWCGASPPTRSLNATTTSSFSSSYHSKRNDSVLSNPFNSSVISRKYSNTSSTLGTTELECVSPLNTLNEAPEELCHPDPPGYNSNGEEGEASRLTEGDRGALHTRAGMDAASEET